MRFEVIDEPDKLQKFVNRIIKDDLVFAVDLETDGLNPYRNDVVGVGLCFHDSFTIYIPLRHKYGQKDNLESLIDVMKPIFSRTFCAYNSIFDVEFLKKRLKYPVDLTKVIDSQLLYYLKGEYTSLSLSAAAKDILNFEVSDFGPFMASQGLSKAKHKISDASIDSVAAYCGRDVMATYLIYKELFDLFKDTRIYKTESALLPVIYWLKGNGVLIDRTYFDKEHLRIKDVMKQVEFTIKKEVVARFPEMGDINLNSWKQVSTLLFSCLELKPVKETKKTGGKSTDEETLFELRDSNRIVWNLHTFRKLQKLYGSYLGKFSDLIESDGRIHAHYSQVGAITGRFSSSNPNLQNIPNENDLIIKTLEGKDKKVAFNIRDGFIAPEGTWLVEFDYNQIEARIAAGVTREHVLLDSFASGVDFHTKTASLVFSVPVYSVSQHQRSIAKTLNFALIYGGGPRVVYKQFKKAGIPVTMSEAKEMRNRYMNSYNTMFMNAERISILAKKKKYAVTMLGRKVPLRGIDSEDEDVQSHAMRTAYNATIQGTAADILKLSMINLFRELEKLEWLNLVKFVMTIHDSVIFEVADHILFDFIVAAQNWLKFEHEKFPSIFSEVKIGKKWGKLKKIKNNETLEDYINRVKMEEK